MLWKEFEKTYINYSEKIYPEETVESVRRCYVESSLLNSKRKEIGKIKKIKKSNALDDVKDFFNCLRRCYSGYDYFHTDDEWSKIENNLIQKIRNLKDDVISKKTFYNLLSDCIRGQINDSHFTLRMVDIKIQFLNYYWYVYKEAGYGKYSVLYVTDLILKETNKGYEVAKGNALFKTHSVLEKSAVDGLLFPTLFFDEGASIDEKYFLLGVYSDEVVKYVSIDGKKLKAHRIRCDKSFNRIKNMTGKYLKTKSVKWMEDCDEYIIVNHATYILDRTRLDEDKKIYTQDGLIAAKKKYTILNVADNPGGDSDYPESFFKGLNTVGNVGSYTAHLPFPCEVEGTVKNYRITERLSTETGKGDYKGTLIIVMNSGTASSAEMAVSCSCYVPNVVWVGSATKGCGTFGNCHHYILPNSGIICRFGHRLFYYEGFDEGKGYKPDYWIDDKNPVSVAEKYIRVIENKDYSQAT